FRWCQAHDIDRCSPLRDSPHRAWQISRELCPAGPGAIEVQQEIAMLDPISGVDAPCGEPSAVVLASATRGHSSAGQSIGLRSRSCSPKRSLSVRFWSYVDTSAGPDGCWPWTGGPSAE